MMNDPYAQPAMMMGGPMYQNAPSPSDQLNADMMHVSRIENIITQIDPERLLSDIEQRIRRRKKNHFTSQWEDIDKDQKPVSPILVANLISYLSSFLNNNLTFSNYTENEINAIMNLVIHDVIEDLSANAIVYGIENDYAERNRITEVICTTIFSALKRALKGNEANKFWRSVTISGDINNQDGSENKKRGIKDYFKFW